MKICLGYHIGEKSFSKEFKTFGEIDEWFKKFKEINLNCEFAVFNVEVFEL